jgi:TRAP-type mannitol/chloroaromatic compound transport system permease small subunit
MQTILFSINRILNGVSRKTGQIISWLSLLMVIFLAINVLSSWLFQTSSILVTESITWMHRANFLLAAAYTLNSNEHVRVDIFYSRMSTKSKALVDLLGSIFLLLPVSVFIIWSSWSYVALSWRINEVSAEAGGLPYTFIIKGFLILMPALLIIEAINQIIINSQRLIGTNDSIKPKVIDNKDNYYKDSDNNNQGSQR